MESGPPAEGWSVYQEQLETERERRGREHYDTVLKQIQWVPVTQLHKRSRSSLHHRIYTIAFSGVKDAH